MDAQIAPFVQTLDMLHEDIYKALETLTDEEINWRHPHLSNTIGILLRHIAGSERFWIVEVAGGRPIGRNRDEEFTGERLSLAPLLSHLRAAQAEVTGVVRTLDARGLMEEVEHRGTPHRFTRAWVILHSIQHTAYHLGQLQLFRKMATSGAAGQLRPGR